MSGFETHRSRIGCIVIDCRTEDLTDATTFWSAALGMQGRIDDRGKYTEFADQARAPKILLQAVDHAPRVHLDIETDDKDAEADRLLTLGASVVERSDRGWIVMEAPTGHRFCIVNPQGPDFPGDAPVWEAK